MLVGAPCVTGHDFLAKPGCGEQDRASILGIGTSSLQLPGVYAEASVAKAMSEF